MSLLAAVPIALPRFWRSDRHPVAAIANHPLSNATGGHDTTGGHDNTEQKEQKEQKDGAMCRRIKTGEFRKGQNT